LLATNIQEKMQVKKYNLMFKKKWKQLASMSLMLTSLAIRLTPFCSVQSILELNSVLLKVKQSETNTLISSHFFSRRSHP
jgi:hypothetical protein